MAADRILVLYGSYRRNRVGIRLANYVIDRLRGRGVSSELIDARAIDLPMLDRMYKEYPAGEAPARIEALAGEIKAADAFIFIVGEYNRGLQPGLKNLTDHFLEEWYWRPAAVISYSARRTGGAIAGSAWHLTLSELGMIVVSSTIAVGAIQTVFTADGALTEQGGWLEKALPRLVDDLQWWAEASRRQRTLRNPPY